MVTDNVADLNDVRMVRFETGPLPKAEDANTELTLRRWQSRVVNFRGRPHVADLGPPVTAVKSGASI
jgi:hypothetical protein